MAAYVVTSSNNAMAVGESGSRSVFNTLESAKAFAEQMANEYRGDYRVYSLTLIGTYDAPSGGATWIPA
jgi:hypothetical protein